MTDKKEYTGDWDIDDPVKPGYTRIYTDHTGRWYKDYTQAEIDEMNDDPFLKILREEIQKEVDKELIDQTKKIWESMKNE